MHRCCIYKKTNLTYSRSTGTFGFKAKWSHTLVVMELIPDIFAVCMSYEAN